MIPLGRAIPGCLVVVMLAAVPAQSQGIAWTDRGYVTIVGGAQVTTATSLGSAHPVEFIEPARVDTTYMTTPAPTLGAAGGVRVWRSLAVGGGLSYFGHGHPATVQAQVPHPFLFGQPRAVSGDTTALSHNETRIDLQARWVWPATRTRRWQLDLFGGPSVFLVGQDVVQDVRITQSYPYDSATFAGVSTIHQSRARPGFHAGADVSRLVAKRVALGVSLSAAHASVGLTTADGSALTVSAGGLQVGAVVRFVIPRKAATPSRPPARRKPGRLSD